MSYPADRVRDTSATTGTGTLTLNGTPASSFVAWSAGYAVGDLVPYCIAHQSANEFEVGMGILVTATTLSRAINGVQNSSSGAGVLVNFSAGTKDVFSPATAKNTLSFGVAVATREGAF